MTTRLPSLAELQAATAPHLCDIVQIEPQWIDGNGHLNMAYYNVIFDRSDMFSKLIGMGEDYLKTRNLSTMTAECHVRYLREVHLGDPLQVSVLLVGCDDKRLHCYKELRHATEGWLSATAETMSLHVDMNLRKVAPFPADVIERLQALAAAHANVPRPDAVGGRIEMRSNRVTRG